jgi:hypothetical protein
MNILKLKTLYILSNGSSFYNYSSNYKNNNNFLFYEKDIVSLYKKKTNLKKKLDSSSNYKQKYLN